MKELFIEFEVDREPRAGRMLRALAAAFALHLTIVAAIIYVPALRSAFAIVNLFRQADYVSEDYEPTKIGERVTIVKVDGDKFQYPAGYFALLKSNFKTEEAKSVVEVKPKPKPTPKPTPRPTPKPTPSPEQKPQTAKSETGKSDETNAAKDEVEKKTNEADKIAESAGVKKFPRINSKPFKDLLKEAAAKKEAGELDLSGTIQMTIEADRNDDGTLSNVVVTSSSGNPALKDIAKRTVQALSDSRALAVLEDAHHLKLFVSADQKTISVRAVTRVATAERAAEMEKGYSALLLGQHLKARFEGKTEEATIYNNTRVSSNGDEVIVKFEISREAAGQMIQKEIAKS